MRSILLAGGLLLVVVAGACSGVKVTSDFEPDYDYANLKTFGFMDLPEGEGLPSGVEKLTRDYIRVRLDSAGYTESDDPDFKIALHGQQRNRPQTQTYGYIWATDHKTVDFEIEEGTIFMDFVDPDSNELFWRAAADAGYSRNVTWQQKEQMVERSVWYMLQRFPPKIKK